MVILCKDNQLVLQLIALLFLLFVVAEVVGAIIRNSLSLASDASAMSVDVLSYFANMYAEHYKGKQEI